MASITVSQFSSYLENLIKRDPFLSNISIEGEVSNLSVRQSFLFFDLKDEKASLSCIVYGNKVASLGKILKDGKKIIASGSVNIYEKASKYQLIVRQAEELGLGKIYEDYIKLKEKLSKEGLFDQDHKKELIKYPSRIGLITSLKGAAVHDFLKVVSRRYPYLEIYLYPSRVQGQGAAQEIIGAIRTLDGMALDAIVVTRGGGSFEDLFEFNNEDLARLVYNSETPIVSAIGHESDISIIELVSDHRAATPTEAAEKITPNIEEMKDNSSKLMKNIGTALLSKIKAVEMELYYLKKELDYKNPIRQVEEEIKRVDLEIASLTNILAKRFSDGENKVKLIGASLKNHDAKRIIKLGYSIIKKDDEIITSVDQVADQDRLDLVMSDGQVEVIVDGEVDYGD